MSAPGSSRLSRLLPAAVAGPLRRMLHRWVVWRFPRRVVERVYAGHRLRIWLADPLSEGWYGHDWRPMAEVSALRRSRLRAGARVFDLGAHHGVVALILAREVAPGGRVVAVEPSRHNAEIARRNVELNAPGTVEVICAAAAARSGTVLIRPGWQVRIESATSGGDTIEVPAVTVDGLAERFGQPDVVFVDVEGAEHLVLQGAGSVIAAGADFCVEVHAGEGLENLGGAVADVLSAFPSDRYRFQIRAGDNDDEDAFVPFDPESPILTKRFFLLATTAGPRSSDLNDRRRQAMASTGPGGTPARSCG